MKLLKKIKVSPVPAFESTGLIKYRSMSFGSVDSLKAYLDATLMMTPEGKIAITYEDAEQIIDYLPTYFENKDVEYVDSYDKFFKSTGVTVNLRGAPDPGTFGTMIPLMTTGMPKRVTGYLSSSSQSLE